MRILLIKEAFSLRQCQLPSINILFQSQVKSHYGTFKKSRTWFSIKEKFNFWREYVNFYQEIQIWCEDVYCQYSLDCLHCTMLTVVNLVEADGSMERHRYNAFVRNL